MAMTAPSSDVLDILFDEQNGVLKDGCDFEGKTPVETLNFGDLDLLSSDLLDFIPQNDPSLGDVFDFGNFSTEHPQLETIPPAKKQKTHSDHDYFAHLSPSQHSDSGVSVNSLENDESYLPSMAYTDDHRLADMKSRTFSSSSHSPRPSDSMSPLSDTNSDSNHLSLEDFDFSSCMDFGAKDNLSFDTVDTSAVSSSKDTDVSIDFDFSKTSEFFTTSAATTQHVQTIKTSSGQQAIILVDANTRQPIKIHSVLSRKTSDLSSSSLPFTMKDIDSDLYADDDGEFPDLRLTDEEKELLAREGVSLPTNMPLTKEEERVLKAVRRKIRNKISAKESRKRKQGYVDGLERRVKICTQENQQLHKRVDNLNKENKSLIVQLNKLKVMVSGGSKASAQASTCILVLAMSFALLVIPNISPFASDTSNTFAKEGGLRGSARSLLGKEEQQVPKVSLFDEESAGNQDSDPYGVSRKPGMPWDDQTPAVISPPLQSTEEADQHSKKLNYVEVESGNARISSDNNETDGINQIRHIENDPSLAGIQAGEKSQSESVPNNSEHSQRRQHA